MTRTALTRKITSIYVAYAPEFNVSAYGGCRDEALNNLTDQLRDQKKAATQTGEGERS
jgi:hypothetical protein